jgi:hypothetical protein
MTGSGPYNARLIRKLLCRAGRPDLPRPDSRLLAGRKAPPPAAIC